MADDRVILEGPQLEGVLPHRGRNLIIDRDECYTKEGEPFGEAALLLADGDEAGRDIFLRGAAGGKAVMEFAFAEHLALNAISVLKSVGEGLKEGDICYFASITGSKTSREIAGGEQLCSIVSRKADKGPFRRFSGAIATATGEPVAQCDINSFTLHLDDEAPRDMLKKGEVVACEIDEPVDRAVFGWKHAAMVFVDSMVSIGEEERTAAFSYAYPADHPFAAGHFPGNPIMMGITQWMCVSDAAMWLARELVLRGAIAAGDLEIVCSGELLRDDGTIVAEVKKMTKRCTIGAGGEVDAPELVSTKRVVFRDMVRPGEPLRVRARITRIGPAGGE